MTTQHKANDMMLFAGNANPKLAADISDILKVPLSEITLDRFNDGEIKCELYENVRDTDAYIIQGTCPPVNENLMELLVLADALKRASARRVTAVIPYYGYARQDRKDKQRVPITSRLIADMLEASGVDRIIVVHLHSAQVQGFFNLPVDHLYTSNELVHAIGNEKDYTVVSADAGGVKRSRVFAELLGGAPLAIIDKRRSAPGKSEALHIIGEVKGRDCLIAEDMIDTGGTLMTAAESLKNAGANSICVCATHPVLSKNAIKRLEASAIDKVYVMDSVPHEELEKSDTFEVVTLAPLLANAIQNLHEGKSLSILFE